ncbi:signal transduction histidine-protein kinase BaeS [Candidatus Thiomargarita nelsonii]|uniref:histidine kinase n=1 Tax=Candidatus Thiomargarita nelsonii TaxID=1003181 RepID=A0A176S2Z0_9GAMM|nr:signal transduction histidine-protein kinase BaeS [Candidatus Thiomargarita nelsonii]
MIIILYFYLSKNFIEFINQRDVEMLNELGNTFSIEYKTYQGWDRLKNNPALLRKFLRDARKQFDRPPALKRRIPKESYFSQRFALFDAQKQRIIGNTTPFKQQLTKSILVDRKIVGWMGIKKIEHLSKHQDIEFLRRQANAFYLTGFLVLLMTALVAWWLSKHLLTPIQLLIEGTQALSSRQFKTRIEIHSRDELGQLADDFNIMAQTLYKYEEMRKQWLSDISHEMRTPLSIMRGEIEAMQDGVRDFNRDALDSLHLEVQRITRIVDDLRELSLAETDSLSFKKESINPLQILRQTLKLFQTRLAQHHIQVQDNFRLNDNIILQGDADRLSQLFSNLLENTLRYVDSPGTLKIWHERTKTQLTLNLIDSGPGVPKESIERLFDRLYRVEQSRNRAKGGSGLGLAICKSIVEMHGGEITATNVPSNGLWIKIVLPLLK